MDNQIVNVTCLNWDIILSFIACSVAIIGSIYGFLRNFKSDIVKRIDSLEDLDRAHVQRIDRLYELYVESQNRMEQRFREVDQKFYDLLKAQSRRTDP